jgi:hypothetical protein
MLLKRTLVQLGLEPNRVKLVWASAAEGVKLAEEIAKMVEEVRVLGPLQWPQGVAAANLISADPSAEPLEEVTA